MYCRHDLIWLTPLGWRFVCERASARYRPALEHWQRQNWPAVVRRSEVGTDSNVIYLGVALPPDEAGEKLRIPIDVLRWHIERVRPPMSLAEMLPHLPAQRWPAFASFVDEAKELNFDICLFGSFALQALTQQSYLHEKSDIDILFRPRDVDQLEIGIAWLKRYAEVLPLDGEIAFDDVAVPWKEWPDIERVPNQRVLVKHNFGVSLCIAQDLLSKLPA